LWSAEWSVRPCFALWSSLRQICFNSIVRVSRHYMGHLVYGRHCERSDEKTSWPHFSSGNVALHKKLCAFFDRMCIQKKTSSILASCRFLIWKLMR
jgi:hypothetical protein